MISLPYFVEREDALDALRGPEKPSEALLALIVAEPSLPERAKIAKYEY